MATTGPTMNSPSDKNGSGYWVQFKRGYWYKSNPPHQEHTESAEQYGHYSGSVTQAEAEELGKIVCDYLSSREQPPRFTAIGMRDFIARAIAYWKTQPGEHAKAQAAEMAAWLTPRTAVGTMIANQQEPDEDLRRAAAEARSPMSSSGRLTNTTATSTSPRSTAHGHSQFDILDNE